MLTLLDGDTLVHGFGRVAVLEEMREHATSLADVPQSTVVCRNPLEWLVKTRVYQLSITFRKAAFLLTNEIKTIIIRVCGWRNWILAVNPSRVVGKFLKNFLIFFRWSL